MFADGSHEWGLDGSGDYGRVAIEESDVSTSSRGGLCILNCPRAASNVHVTLALHTVIVVYGVLCAKWSMLVEFW